MRTVLDSISKRFFLIITTAMLMLMVTVGTVHAADFSLEKFASDNAVWIGLVFMIIEYILGKTTLVKSGSSLELVINTVVGLLKKVFGTSSGLKGL